MSPTSRATPHIWILALAVSSANLGLALLSPAIPSLRADFNTNADNAQLVLSIFMIAVGVGQLIAGTLSDRLGRRPVMLMGAFMFAIGGLFALFVETIGALILCRLVQGLGAAGCMAMGRVIINDSFARNEAGRQMSTITMVQAVVPVLGFAFGGAIADFVGWRGAIFIMFVGSGTTFLAALLLLAETRDERLPVISAGKVMSAYGALVTTRLFVTNAVNSAMVVGMFFSMGGFMPYQFVRYGLDALDFGLFFSFTSVGYIIGNSINRQYGWRLGIDRVVLIGTTVGLLVIFLMLLSHLAGRDTHWTTTVLCFGFGIGNGLTVANCIVGAVRAAGPHSGSATGLVGCVQMLSGAAFGSLVIALGGDASFAVALSVLLVMAAVSWICSYLALQPRNLE